LLPACSKSPWGTVSLIPVEKKLANNFSDAIFYQVIWGRCYDHSFLRFLSIFGEKIDVFHKKTNEMIKFLQKLAATIFAKFLGENIF
jgi:hypothetical protein